jgi:hypothetical protein
MDKTLNFRPILKRVFLCHLLFVLALYLMPSSYPQKTERVQVKTVKLAPKKESVPNKTAAPKKKVEAKKKETPKKAEKPKAKTDRKELLKRVQQSVAKMESMEATSKSSETTNLKPIGTLSFQGVGEEEGYINDLTARLKSKLHLPEYGQVHIYLTVLRSGKIDSFEIVDSSRINKKYLVQALKELAFPPFGKWYPKEEKHTFALTLSNELY